MQSIASLERRHYKKRGGGPGNYQKWVVYKKNGSFERSNLVTSYCNALSVKGFFTDKKGGGGMGLLKCLKGFM
jgi:hypothetical protein